MTGPRTSPTVRSEEVLAGSGRDSPPGARSTGSAPAAVPRCAVVVLGDLGRSPRILRQALSLAELAQVDLVGYAGAELPAAVRDHPAVAVHRLPSEPPLEQGRGRLMWVDAARRLLRQSRQLSRLLLHTLPRPDLLLVQNPPSLPTLAVIWLVARIRGASWVIDWHNLGFSVLALKLGAEHRATRLARRCEIMLGRRADAHLCVSAELREALLTRWGIGPAHVLYDRPAGERSPSAATGHGGEFLRGLLADLDLLPAREGSSSSTHAASPSAGTPRHCRPAVVVSPTSWSLDEDYGLLLEALDRCQLTMTREKATGASFPEIAILLTGMGPLRAEFEARIREARWSEIRARTALLSPDDYARLLASADLGLCLHRSSSGLDLPMKIADMLGAGLPVCALDYARVLAEQFRSGEQGVSFASAEELGDLLVALFRDFPQPGSRLEALRRSLRERPVERWQSGWDREAYPLFARLLQVEERGAPRTRPAPS